MIELISHQRSSIGHPPFPFLRTHTTVMHLRRWIIAAALASAVPAQAQTPKTAEIPENVFADAPGDSKGNKKAERLQKIERLTFDRRPSTVLKEWSTSDEDRKKE